MCGIEIVHSISPSFERQRKATAQNVRRWVLYTFQFELEFSDPLGQPPLI
jgi:hypothetical protein